MKSYIKSVVALTAICAVVAILLAVTNFVTAPIIEKNAAAAANEALMIVLPEGEDFTQVDLTKYELPATVTEVYTETGGGCVVKLVTAGYGPDMVLMCGINANGEIAGATCLSSNETLGVEKTYGDNVKGYTVDNIDSDLDTVSGATMTTGAYKNALKDALNTAIIVGGGSADIRTEEEKLADNLNTALPSAEGKFTKWFVTESITDVSEVYVADNGKGYVLISGESFIAVDSDGNVLTDVSDDVKSVMSANVETIKTSELTEIDITGYENMPKAIDKAYKTASGNYLFELHAAGYGINGDKYTASGEYINIKVSVTADGKILACETVSQKETDKIGSVCGDASFYSQFNGKDETNYGDIDAISGATITTNGYKTGISRVFEAVKIMEGVA